MSKHRRLRWTLFNYTQKDEEILQQCTIGSDKCKTYGENYQKGDKKPFITYLVYGYEEAPTTGKKHLQGYFEFNTQMTISNLKKKLDNQQYAFFQCNASAEHNRNYATDNDKNKFVEIGSPKKQGERTDLKNLKDEIMNKQITVREIIKENPDMYHKYGRTLEKIEEISNENVFRNWQTTCDWYYGPTGVGKSHKAFENYNPETHYIWKDDNGWQDGYKGQEIVIINEFRGKIPYEELLLLIDKWPHNLRRRGRPPVPFLAKHIIITSSMSPKECYKDLENTDSLEQLYRRIKTYFKILQEDDWELRNLSKRQ